MKERNTRIGQLVRVRGGVSQYHTSKEDAYIIHVSSDDLVFPHVTKGLYAILYFEKAARGHRDDDISDYSLGCIKEIHKVILANLGEKGLLDPFRSNGEKLNLNPGHYDCFSVGNLSLIQDIAVPAVRVEPRPKQGRLESLI